MFLQSLPLRPRIVHRACIVERMNRVGKVHSRLGKVVTDDGPDYTDKSAIS